MFLPLVESQAATLDLSDGSGVSGGTVSINITLNKGGESVSAVAMDIGFDSNMLSNPKAEINSTIGSGTDTDRQLISSRPSPGILRIGIIPANLTQESLQAVIPDGLVAAITFDIGSGVAPGTTMALTNMPSASTSVGQALPAVGKNGAVGVGVEIHLEKGWNLFSIHLNPADTSILSVLKPIEKLYHSVWTYDTICSDPIPGWKKYIVDAPPGVNDLDKIVSKKGYWINMTQAGTLVVTGEKMTNTATSLCPKWNLVGYNCQTAQALKEALSCIINYVLAVWSYDGRWEKYILIPLPGFGELTMFKPTKGYWIYVTNNCEWDPCAPPCVPVPAPPVAWESVSNYILSDRPEIPYIIYGNVEVDGVKVKTKAGLKPAPAVILKAGNKTQASYQLGSVEQYGDLYVLDVPVNTESFAPIELCVQIGDSVIKAVTIPPGIPGQAIRLDLSVQRIPKVSMLYQNYPNPFNPDTWIPYQLKEDANVEIRIYTSTGQFVRILDLGRKPTGFYIMKEKAGYWDGKNEAGEAVASGVYFYTIQAGEFTATKKMAVAK